MSSDQHDHPPGGGASTTNAGGRPEITTWKKLLLGMAALFIVVGSVLRFAGGESAVEEPSSGAGSSTVPASGLLSGGGAGDGASLPGAQGDDGAESAAAEPDVSLFFLKGGFSFFVAFCVGYATRVWLKVTVLVFGTFFGGLFLLSYLGVISVDWDTIGTWYDDLASGISGEVADFRTFLAGSLPQAGLAGLGLLTGFKRR